MAGQPVDYRLADPEWPVDPMITTTAQNGRTLADLTTHAGGPGVSDKLRSFRKPTPMQDFFDVPSHIATDITTIDQHPTDACMSPRLSRALIEGPDKTRAAEPMVRVR